MIPELELIREGYKGPEEFWGKIVLITGGELDIGRVVAAHLAREGAVVATCYFPAEQSDTKKVH